MRHDLLRDHGGHHVVAIRDWPVDAAGVMPGEMLGEAILPLVQPACVECQMVLCRGCGRGLQIGCLVHGYWREHGWTYATGEHGYVCSPECEEAAHAGRALEFDGLRRSQTPAGLTAAVRAYRAAWEQLDRGSPDMMHKSGDVDRMKRARAGLWGALDHTDQAVSE